jgi:cadmium resistance protein CadD (predicted permease)
VSSLPAEIATAAALFAGTNVDDLVVLGVLSASAQAATAESASPLRRWQLWGGQYAGFTVLVGLSLAAGRGLAVIPEHWLGLLALVPIALGVVRLAAAVRSQRSGEPPPAPSAGGLGGVAALTIVNGADNLAVYTPFFAASDAGRIAVTLAVFAVGVALWCLAGWLLVRHSRAAQAVQRYGHWILPVAFILIGLYLLQELGAFARL